MLTSTAMQEIPPEDKSFIGDLVEVARGNWIISAIIGIYLISYLDKLLKAFIHIPEKEDRPSTGVESKTSAEAQALLGLTMLLVQSENDIANKDEEIDMLNEVIRQLSNESRKRETKYGAQSSRHLIVLPDDTGDVENCYDCHG